MRRLTILHVDTERGWRGGQRQVLLLARGLRRLGHRNLIVTRPGSPLAERAAADGIEVVPIRPVCEVDPIAAWRIRRVAMREGADIVHAHAGHASMLAALATVRSAPRVVITRRVDFKPNDNLFSQWKYRRAHAIIAISRAVAEALKAGGVSDAHLSIAASGVEIGSDVAAAAPPLDVHGIPAGAPLVVTMAALVPHKDPLGFVRAFAVLREHCPNAHALMLGEGELRPQVEALRDALGLTGGLHLAGFVDDPLPWVAAADVFAVSSVEEGMGTCLLDAMKLGRPIVATRAGGIPEVVEHEASGILVPPRDARALGDALWRLLQDRELALRLAAEARRRVQAFSIARTVQLTCAVYEQALSERARATDQRRPETLSVAS